MVTSEWLGKEVGEVVSRSNLFEENRFRFDKLMKIVMADVDMFYLSMVLSGLWKSDCSSAIPLDYTRQCMFHLNFIQPCLHPCHLLSTSRHCDILGFNRGECDCRLSLTTPGHSSSSHCEDISRSRSTSIATSSIVSINIGNRSKVHVLRISQTIVHSISDIPYDM